MKQQRVRHHLNTLACIPVIALLLLFTALFVKRFASSQFISARWIATKFISSFPVCCNELRHVVNFMKQQFPCHFLLSITSSQISLPSRSSFPLYRLSLDEICVWQPFAFIGAGYHQLSRNCFYRWWLVYCALQWSAIVSIVCDVMWNLHLFLVNHFPFVSLKCLFGVIFEMDFVLSCQ